MFVSSWPPGLLAWHIPGRFAWITNAFEMGNAYSSLLCFVPSIHDYDVDDEHRAGYRKLTALIPEISIPIEWCCEWDALLPVNYRMHVGGIGTNQCKYAIAHCHPGNADVTSGAIFPTRNASTEPKGTLIKFSSYTKSLTNHTLIQ